MRTKNYTKVICKSTNREALMRCAERVHLLFEPRLVELKDEERRFLMEIDRGSILEKVEHEYHYSIAFELNRFAKSLAVFCPSVHFDDIVSKIKGHMKKSEYVSSRVSYRGKNLKEVLSIITQNKEELQAKNKDGRLEFEILFNRKMVNITTLPTLFDRIKGQIEGLSSPINSDC
jgi:hypothetical protein